MVQNINIVCFRAGLDILKGFSFGQLLGCVYFSGSRFERTSAIIRLPDDCTVGFIVEKRLGISMVHCPLFHSHLENLLLVNQRSIPHQVVTGTHTHGHKYA